MGQREKSLLSILSGLNDKSIMFSDLQKTLDWLGFSCRIKGDYFIFTKEGIKEIINIQPLKDKAKPYQVRQVRNIILDYKLGGAVDEV